MSRKLDVVTLTGEEFDSMQDGIAELNRLRGLLKSWADETLLREGPRIDAPGHSHEVAGVWDSDNGGFAGKTCAKCALWREAKHMRCDVPNAEVSGAGTASAGLPS